MKKLIFAVMILGGISDAFGRIGETLEECNARYGRPLRQDNGLVDDKRATTFVYAFRGFVVAVGILDGKSEIEFYSKQKPTEEISAEEIANLLNANAKDKSWKEATGSDLTKKYWSTEGNLMTANYTLIGRHELTIRTSKWENYAEESRKSKARDATKGF